MNISAVIPTRGDVDMAPILNSLPFDDIIVWDNSQREDLSCYGRFAAIDECRHDWIYTQDDDILVPIPGLLKQWPRDREIFANKPVHEEWRFLGVGALFPRDFTTVFQAYTDRWGKDADFHRVSDVVFAYQHPYRSVWVGYAELEYSRYENRMYRQPDHYDVRIRARERVTQLG